MRRHARKLMQIKSAICFTSSSRLPLCIKYSVDAYYAIPVNQHGHQTAHKIQLTRSQTPNTVAKQHTTSDQEHTQHVLHLDIELRSFKPCIPRHRPALSKRNLKNWQPTLNTTIRRHWKSWRDSRVKGLR